MIAITVAMIAITVAMVATTVDMIATIDVKQLHHNGATF